MNKIIALASVFGIYAFAGWRGMVVAIAMIVIFELMHKRVYGKSIARIGE